MIIDNISNHKAKQGKMSKIMNRYDYIVIGAGLAGGVIARKLAEERGKKVLIIERRKHIAGNMYDYIDSHGVKVQKYGPHVFHTNNSEVYDFISKYCVPVNYKTKCEAVIDDITTPSPFNFKTIDQFYSKEEAEELKKRLSNYYTNRSSITVVDMFKSNDEKIRNFANFLFEKDYKPYTAKQWNLSPSQIDPSVLKRVPIILSYEDTYFNDQYEFMPDKGFLSWYENMIDHHNINIKLETDALKYITFDDDKKEILYDGIACNIIYTGAIDELCKYRYGVLPYRSLYFDFQSIQTKSFQNTAIVAYPQIEDYTRITEYTKMPFQDCNGWTCVAYEYPVKYDKHAKIGFEPYYPVLTEESKNIYKKYKKYVEQYVNLKLCGRLAEFKYYNMDQVIIRALEIYHDMEG